MYILEYDAACLCILRSFSGTYVCNYNHDSLTKNDIELLLFIMLSYELYLSHRQPYRSNVELHILRPNGGGRRALDALRTDKASYSALIGITEMYAIHSLLHYPSNIHCSIFVQEAIAQR